MDVSLRDARSEDLSRVLALHDELHGAENARRRDPTPEESLAWGEICRLRSQILVVAEDTNGDLVAAVDLIFVENLTRNGRPFGLIENVIVTAARRRRGIGRKLMAAAVNRAREHGCYKVQFLSNRARTDSHEFYRALGFERQAVGFRLYLDEAH